MYKLAPSLSRGSSRPMLLSVSIEDTQVDITFFYY
jgi:hypothetical protein